MCLMMGSKSTASTGTFAAKVSTPKKILGLVFFLKKNVMVNNLKITTRGDVGRVQDDVQMNLSRISKVFIF